MKLKTITLGTLLAASIAVAHAQSGGMKGMDMKDGDMGKAAAVKAHKASGKVTKVDKSGGAVTIAHGPVASLNWPSMTMSFKVKDKAMLDRIKSGDQVEFSFVQSGRDYTVTDLK